MSKVLENCEPMLSNKIVNGEKNLNPSCPNPERREKIKLSFYFSISLWCLKRFSEGLKDLHKTF